MFQFSGLGAAVTIFDENEIVAGDLVMVELDLDVFKMIHEAAGIWKDFMKVVTLFQNLCTLAVLYEGCDRVLDTARNPEWHCSQSVVYIIIIIIM